MSATAANRFSANIGAAKPLSHWVPVHCCTTVMCFGLAFCTQTMTDLGVITKDVQTVSFAARLLNVGQRYMSTYGLPVMRSGPCSLLASCRRPGHSGSPARSPQLTQQVAMWLLGEPRNDMHPNDFQTKHPHGHTNKSMQIPHWYYLWSCRHFRNTARKSKGKHVALCLRKNLHDRRWNSRADFAIKQPSLQLFFVIIYV